VLVVLALVGKAKPQEAAEAREMIVGVLNPHPSPFTNSQQGTALSGGICIIPADQLHLTFEESVQDLSGQGRHGFIYGPDNMSFVTAPYAAEGYYSARFSAETTPQNFLSLLPFAIGGRESREIEDGCIKVFFFSLTWYPPFRKRRPEFLCICELSFHFELRVDL